MEPKDKNAAVINLLDLLADEYAHSRESTDTALKVLSIQEQTITHQYDVIRTQLVTERRHLADSETKIRDTIKSLISDGEDPTGSES